MTELLLRALYVGLWAAGLVVLLRTMPLVQRFVREGKKPWACDVCMSFWSTFGVAIGLVFFKGWEFAAAGPGFAIALLTLRKLTEPLRAPGKLSELVDSE